MNKNNNRNIELPSQNTELEAICEQWLNLVLTHINYKKKDFPGYYKNNKNNE